MEILQSGRDIILENAENFNIFYTLDCGQAFRWRLITPTTMAGIAYGKYLEIEQIGGKVIFHNTSMEDFDTIWRNYFDLNRNYGDIISRCSVSELLKKSFEFGKGIRIINQLPWEALCSFIISQNNNIPRIKLIIERLCEAFGNKIPGGYTFPDAKTVANLSEAQLAPLKAGFRTRYILDAAQKVAVGLIDFEYCKALPYEEAAKYLMQIKGVGPKVADCCLLFGLGFIDALPRDVWIKRVLQKGFPQGIPTEIQPYAGIIQQYLFFYARKHPEEF